MATPEPHEQRLFVAVVPPEPVLDRLAALRRPEVAGVRWTTRDQWHVTLRFLGRTAVEPAVAALDSVHEPGVAVGLGPRVVRLGNAVAVVAASGLEGLAAAVEGATTGLGEPVPDRPFVGHLTVARSRGRGRIDAAALGEPIAATFVADQVVLMSSQFDARGARYSVVARRSLGDTGPT